ncbi:hypothetical protein BC628DRAFT_1331981, partial [Trametes gibbosa]
MFTIAHELAEIGVEVPGIISHSDDVATPVCIPPEDHHHIASTEKNFVDLREWQAENPDDPVVEAFVPDLKEHLRQRLQDEHPSLTDPDVPIILHHDRVYHHATAHVNYTSYDLQREQDILHPSIGKSDILVHTPSVEEHTRHPWSYARVLGIYH